MPESTACAMGMRPVLLGSMSPPVRCCTRSLVYGVALPAEEVHDAPCGCLRLQQLLPGNGVQHVLGHGRLDGDLVVRGCVVDAGDGEAVLAEPEREAERGAGREESGALGGRGGQRGPGDDGADGEGGAGLGLPGHEQGKLADGEVAVPVEVVLLLGDAPAAQGGLDGVLLPALVVQEHRFLPTGTRGGDLLPVTLELLQLEVLASVDDAPLVGLVRGQALPHLGLQDGDLGGEVGLSRLGLLVELLPAHLGVEVPEGPLLLVDLVLLAEDGRLELRELLALLGCPLPLALCLAAEQLRLLLQAQHLLLLLPLQLLQLLLQLPALLAPLVPGLLELGFLPRPGPPLPLRPVYLLPQAPRRLLPALPGCALPVEHLPHPGTLSLQDRVLLHPDHFLVDGLLLQFGFLEHVDLHLQVLALPTQLGHLGLLLVQVPPLAFRRLLQIRVLLQLDHLLHDDLLLHRGRPLLQLLDPQGQLPQLPLHGQLPAAVLWEAEQTLVLLHGGPQLLHLPLQLPPPARLLVQAPAQPAVLLVELRVPLGDHHLLHHHLLLGPPPLQQQVLVLQLVDHVLGRPSLLGHLPHLPAQPLGLLLQDRVLLVAHHLLVHRLGLHLGALPSPLVALPLQPDELLLGPPAAVDQLVELGLQVVHLPQHLRVPLVPHHLLRHLLVLHHGLLRPQGRQLGQQPRRRLLHAAPLAGGLLQLGPEPRHLPLRLRIHLEDLVDTLLQVHPGLLLLLRAVLATQLLQLPGQRLVLPPLRLQEAPQPGRLSEEAWVLLHPLHLLHDHLRLHGADRLLQLRDASLQPSHGCLRPLPLRRVLLRLQPQGLGCLDHFQVLLHLDHFLHHDLLLHVRLLPLKGQQLRLQRLQLGQDGGVLPPQELDLAAELGRLAVQARVPLDLGDLLAARPSGPPPPDLPAGQPASCPRPPPGTSPWTGCSPAGGPGRTPPLPSPPVSPRAAGSSAAAAGSSAPLARAAPGPPASSPPPAGTSGPLTPSGLGLGSRTPAVRHGSPGCPHRASSAGEQHLPQAAELSRGCRLQWGEEGTSARSATGPGRQCGSGWASPPYLLQDLSGKLQLVQLLLVRGCNLSVGLQQLLLLKRPQGGGGGRCQLLPQRLRSPAVLRNEEYRAAAHLGLDALLQGSHSGSLGGRPRLGGLQGAALVGNLVGPVSGPHLVAGQVLQPGVQAVPAVLELLVGEVSVLHHLLPAGGRSPEQRVVAVREGPHLALLARQVLAELVEIAVQRAARVLGGLQLAVQPQHAGLLLQQLPPPALGQEGTQRGHPAPHLQLADPLLQRAWAYRDGGLLHQGGLEASDDPVRIPDLPLQTQGSLGSATEEAKGQTPPWPHPCGLAQRPPSPEHSLLPVESAENLHVTVNWTPDTPDAVTSKPKDLLGDCQVPGQWQPRPGVGRGIVEAVLPHSVSFCHSCFLPLPPQDPTCSTFPTSGALPPPGSALHQLKRYRTRQSENNKVHGNVNNALQIFRNDIQTICLSRNRFGRIQPRLLPPRCGGGAAFTVGTSESFRDHVYTPATSPGRLPACHPGETTPKVLQASCCSQDSRQNTPPAAGPLLIPAALVHPPCGFGCGPPGPPVGWCGSAGPGSRSAPASLSASGPPPAGSSVSGASGPVGQLGLSWLELGEESACEGPGPTSRLPGGPLPECLRRVLARGLPTQEMESPEQKSLIQGHPLPVAALTGLQLRGQPGTRRRSEKDVPPLSPLGPSRHWSRRRPGNGLKPQGPFWAHSLPPVPEDPQADPPGGPGHGFRVRSWDAEAGGWGTLGLACRALDHPGVRVSVVYQRIPLTLQQLHLGGRWGGAHAGSGAGQEKGSRPRWVEAGDGDR
eukprot:bmy_13794T0